MRRRSVTSGLVLLAYVLALVQRPGDVVADTKVDLYVAPARFLGRVLSVWSPTTDLGHVFGAQYSGYAWPMAPWFAAGDALGIPTWVVHRLWLGTLLAVAAVGIVWLLDALATPRRGVLHAAAGVLFIVNPYVAVYANRTSISLLSYAALPWLMLAVHRSLREPKRWRWPAVFALVLTTTGGGVNVAVTAWLLVGPVMLWLYERFWGGVDTRALRAVAGRMIVVNVIAQLWWIIPVLIQGVAAPSFLPFSEQPGTIWSTTSLPESLRLMGFWTSYVGVGFGGTLRAFQGSAPSLTFLLPVVVAGLAIPAAALIAFVSTRRWRYGPFFLLLTFAGLLVMSAGWPNGTPLRTAATGAYYRVESIEFLRTTYKAGALTALGLAALGGAAFEVAWKWVAARAVPWPRVALVVACVGAVALASWPLVTGRAVERQLAFKVPPAWTSVASDLNARPDSSRAMELPGQLFGYAKWGGTIDPLLPALTDHAVTTRWIVPFADRRATELQWTIDGLVTQDRLKPGQLPSLLDLLGVGDLVVAADGDRSRSGEAPTGDVVRELRAQGLFTGRKTQAYGPSGDAPTGAGQLTSGVRVPELTRTELPTGGVVRVLPRAAPVVVDGGAGGIAALAAFGALDTGRAIAYAPDLGAGGVRAAAGQGGTFVVSDTNRRQAFLASRPRGDVGPVLPPSEGISADGALLDPWLGFPGFETVQRLGGDVKSVTAPASPQVTQFPERRPFAALDGDTSTAWMADRALEKPRHRLTVNFTAPRDVAAIDLMPYSDSRGVVKRVTVNGRAFPVRRGWNHLTLGLRGARSLTVVLTKVTEPDDANGGAGGIRELKVPGLRVSEALRPPTFVEDTLRGRDLSGAGLDYLFQRTTTDVPGDQRRYVGERGAGLLRDAQDAEDQLSRTIDPPAARRYAVDAWATVDPRTPDDVLDGIERGIGGRTDLPLVTSSSRFEGKPRYRGSGAFDGGSRAWIGQWIAGRPAWLRWSMKAPATVRSFVVRPAGVVVRQPTVVALTVDGRRGPNVRVGPSGLVTLPRAVRGRTFRLDVVAARFPAGASAFARQRRAVGIGEVVGAGIPAAVPVPRGGRLALPCGSAAVRVGGTTVSLGGTVDRDALDAGRPVRLRGGCAGEGAVAVAAGPTAIVGLDQPLRVDALRMASAAPSGAAAPASTGRVTAFGDAGPGHRDGVEVAVDASSWLVLDESYDQHWQATCDGRSLGEPRPMQGYANAWPVDRGCTDVDFTYGLQKAAVGGYVVSLVGGLALLVVALLGFGVRRRRRREEDAAPLPFVLPPAGRRPRVALPRAVAYAVVPAVVIAGAFGLRAGAVAFVALVAIWALGIGDRVLAIAAGVLLGIGMPLVYVWVAAFGPDHEGRGGNATDFGANRLAAHWMALAGLILLAVVLWRTLSRARARA
jgi:arabinofuranan 3-O-arabinosyltransferase